MPSPPAPEPSRTSGAQAARRASSQAALTRVREAIRWMRRDKAVISVAAVARRARVSRTFLYQNTDARATVAAAIADADEHRAGRLAEEDHAREATWRERALNAEDALAAATSEIRAQRHRVGELLGQVRDLEHAWTDDTVARMLSENTTLKHQVHTLNADNRTLTERLDAARTNMRFHDRRIADLEARLLEADAATPGGRG